MMTSITTHQPIGVSSRDSLKSADFVTYMKNRFEKNKKQFIEKLFAQVNLPLEAMEKTSLCMKNARDDKEISKPTDCRSPVRKKVKSESPVARKNISPSTLKRINNCKKADLINELKNYPDVDFNKNWKKDELKDVLLERLTAGPPASTQDGGKQIDNDQIVDVHMAETVPSTGQKPLSVMQSPKVTNEFLSNNGSPARKQNPADLPAPGSVKRFILQHEKKCVGTIEQQPTDFELKVKPITKRDVEPTVSSPVIKALSEDKKITSKESMEHRDQIVLPVAQTIENNDTCVSTETMLQTNIEMQKLTSMSNDTHFAEVGAKTSKIQYSPTEMIRNVEDHIQGHDVAVKQSVTSQSSTTINNNAEMEKFDSTIPVGAGVETEVEEAIVTDINPSKVVDLSNEEVCDDELFSTAQESQTFSQEASHFNRKWGVTIQKCKPTTLNTIPDSAHKTPATCQEIPSGIVGSCKKKIGQFTQPIVHKAARAILFEEKAFHGSSDADEKLSAGKNTRRFLVAKRPETLFGVGVGAALNNHKSTVKESSMDQKKKIALTNHNMSHSRADSNSANMSDDKLGMAYRAMPTSGGSKREPHQEKKDRQAREMRAKYKELEKKQRNLIGSGNKMAAPSSSLHHPKIRDQLSLYQQRQKMLKSPTTPVTEAKPKSLYSPLTDCKSSPIKLPVVCDPRDNYELTDTEASDYESDSEIDDESNSPCEKVKKREPEWAQGKKLKKALQYQFSDECTLDPDLYFDANFETCDLVLVFDVDKDDKERKKRLRRRRSSGNWDTDRLTQTDVVNYKNAVRRLARMKKGGAAVVTAA